MNDVTRDVIKVDRNKNDEDGASLGNYHLRIHRRKKEKMQLLIAVTVLATVFEYAFAIPPVQCSRPRCDRGCQIRIINGPCPECDCGGGDTYGNQRCPPVDNCSGLGCKLERDIRGCQYCACPSSNQYDRIPQGIQCDPPKCGYNCQIDYTSRPCPSCRCDGSYNNNNNRIQCSPPRCEYPCYLDNNASPCPTCVCNSGGGGNFRPAMIQCSPPRCNAPCRLNPYTKPCPSCQC
ncbi:wnt inhibitory factor 1-like [Uloborus diversus]|uniref:wnt inhibitory factor 1-like n=1 Tax=Uloborus diversus TaxID=327109 RepID=UPI00240A8C20|nr:wnt inhibitory factor 1-like [Uloborus diversus]